MERLAAASAGATRPLPGDADAVGARVAVLHNKWRTVWRLSVERKKLLQDTLDHLIEVSAGGACFLFNHMLSLQVEPLHPGRTFRDYLSSSSLCFIVTDTRRRHNFTHVIKQVCPSL